MQWPPAMERIGHWCCFVHLHCVTCRADIASFVLTGGRERLHAFAATLAVCRAVGQVEAWLPPVLSLQFQKTVTSLSVQPLALAAGDWLGLAVGGLQSVYFGGLPLMVTPSE